MQLVPAILGCMELVDVQLGYPIPQFVGYGYMLRFEFLCNMTKWVFLAPEKKKKKKFEMSNMRVLIIA